MTRRTWRSGLGAATLAVTGALLAGGAAAQTVYRCGTEGRTYQSEPCADGGHAVKVADPRSGEQRRASREAAASEAWLAERLARERRAREAATVPARAGGIGPEPAPPAAASAPRRSAQPHGYRRYHGYGGTRYFPDGTVVPPVYHVPAQKKTGQ